MRSVSRTRLSLSRRAVSSTHLWSRDLAIASFARAFQSLRLQRFVAFSASMPRTVTSFHTPEKLVENATVRVTVSSLQCRSLCRWAWIDCPSGI